MNTIKKNSLYLIIGMIVLVVAVGMFAIWRAVMPPQQVVNNYSTIMDVREDKTDYYFSNLVADGALYRMEKRTGQLTELFADEVSSPYPTEDRVFFIHNPSDELIDQTIYSINKDGTDLKQYVNNCDRIFYINDNLIYYASVVPMFHLYRYNMETDVVEELTKGSVEYMTVVGDEMYLVTYGISGCSLQKMTGDFSPDALETVHTASAIRTPFYENGKLYFQEYIAATEQQTKQKKISSYNLSNGAVETVKVLNDVNGEKTDSLFVLSVDQNRIYYTAALAEDDTKRAVFCFDQTTNTTQKLFSDENLYGTWYVEGGVFYSSSFWPHLTDVMRVVDYSGKPLADLNQNQ